MIIKVKKYLFYGLKKEIDIFFQKAQEKGIIEFISPSAKKGKEIPPFVKDLILSIKIIKKEPNPLPQKESAAQNIQEFSYKIINLHQKREKLAEEARLLTAEITRVAPFGDFSPEDVEYLREVGKRELQFFCIKSSKAKELKLPEDLIYIGTEYDLDYFAAVNKEIQRYPQLIEIQIEKPVGLLKKRLLEVGKERALVEKEMKGLTAYLQLLRLKLIEQLNFFHLQKAKGEVAFPLDDSLFAIEGWVPVSKENKLLELTRAMAIGHEVISVEKKDREPTYMENNEFAGMGEDLVNIYDVPATADKDPSMWVLLAFALFFAMIISDAGYGLVFLMLGLFLKVKFRRPKPRLRRFANLTLFLSVSCILWGAITGSFFGLGVSPDNPLSKVTFLNYLSNKKAGYHLQKKDDVYDYWKEKYPDLQKASSGKDFLAIAVKVDGSKKQFEAWDVFQKNILMEIALLAGIIHISLAFLRYLPKNYAGAGWVVFILGGYLYFPSILNATSFTAFLGVMDKPLAFNVGFYAIFAGIALAVIGAIIQKGLRGAAEVTSVIGVFADILSYLRLYALGLAGMIMATTFNGMGVAVGMEVGFIIVFLGHVVNITLCLIGGIIHGLRLNFIEWYNHCFIGDGKLFNPLKLLK